jgi:hypothetical protein
MVAMGQADAEAAVKTFAGKARRLVVASSGDVYRAYVRFTGLEPGPVEPGRLTQDSPLRSVLFPYRAQSIPGKEWLSEYEKIVVERTVLKGGERGSFCACLKSTDRKRTPTWAPCTDRATIHAWLRRERGGRDRPGGD